MFGITNQILGEFTRQLEGDEDFGILPAAQPRTIEEGLERTLHLEREVCQNCKQTVTAAMAEKHREYGCDVAEKVS